MRGTLFLVWIPLASSLASALASHFLVCIVSCKPLVGFLYIYNWDITKKCLDFDDLDFDLIFKVTAVEKLKIHGGGTSVFSENTNTSTFVFYIN